MFLFPQLLYTLSVHFVGSNVTAVINVSQSTTVDRETVAKGMMNLINQGEVVELKPFNQNKRLKIIDIC